MRLIPIVASFLLATACGKSEKPAEGTGPAKVDEPAKNPDPTKAADKPADKPTADKLEDKPVDPPPAADPLASWVDFTGPENSYTAKFPGKPTENTETMPVEGLPPQTMRSALYEGPGGTKAFITALVDVNAPAGTVYDVPAGLKGAVDGMLSGMNATMDSSKDMNVGAALGREIAFHGTMDGVSFKGIARVYALGGEKPRLFQANTLVIGGAETEEMRTFLDHFKPNVPAEAAGAATKDAPPAVPGEWVEHDGGFYKVKFPSKPSTQENAMPTAVGERKMLLTVAADDNGGYMVGVVDLQVPDGTPFDTKAAIDGARDGLISSMAGDTKPVEADVEMKGLKGREFKFEATGKGPDGTDIQGVARVLVDEAGGKKVYTLVVVGKKPIDHKGVTQFFDSFEPIAGGKAPTVDGAAAGGDDAGGDLPATCKKFLDTYEQCIKAMPEAAHGPALDGLKQLRSAWTGVPKDALESACKQAWDASKTSMGVACPGVKWE